MFQKIAFTVVFLVASVASAKQLSTQDIRERLQLNADIYLVDASGKKVLSGPGRTNLWWGGAGKGGLGGDWSTQNEDGRIAFRHHWNIEDDGTIKATVEEYAITSEHRENPEFKNLLEKKEFVLENFQPIVWKIRSIKNKNYIVRFIPSLREISNPVSVDNLPVSGTDVTISDNQGYLWAKEIGFGGKYSGVKSHRGTLALSYVPFKGAKEMGTAEGNKIVVNVDKKFQIMLKASTAFLPAGVTAKVYALYLPEKKSKGYNSVHSFDSSKEDRFLASLDMQ